MTRNPERGPTTPESGSVQPFYDERYYANCCGPIPYGRAQPWINFFGVIADEIIGTFKPATVFDAGCAMGLLVEAFRDRGVEAFGIDISTYAISKVREDMKSFCRIGSIVDPIDRQYDVVTCIEVLEHLSKWEAGQAAANLCAATDTILFSSTPTDITEPTHINVQPTIYWLRTFADLGFWPDPAFDASFVAPHAMLLRKGLPPEDSILYAFSQLIEQRLQIKRDRAADSVTPGTDGQLARIEYDYFRLTHRHRHLQARLEAALHSPGWRLLEKYRAWLRYLQAFHPHLFRAVDALARLAVRKASANGTAKSELRDHVRPEFSEAEPGYEKWIAENEPDSEDLAARGETGCFHAATEII
jgi:Methyltransferase domain